MNLFAVIGGGGRNLARGLFPRFQGVHITGWNPNISDVFTAHRPLIPWISVGGQLVWASAYFSWALCQKERYPCTEQFHTSGTSFVVEKDSMNIS